MLTTKVQKGLSWQPLTGIAPKREVEQSYLIPDYYESHYRKTKHSFHLKELHTFWS